MTTAFPKTSPSALSPHLRFALLCALFLLVALGMQPFWGPVCTATATQAGGALALAGVPAAVQGTLLCVGGSAVRIVPECTPLYPLLLYAAFVLANPATPGRTVAGLAAGATVIGAANLARISLLALAASRLPAPFFQILHVYLGQVAMLLLVVGCALMWRGDEPRALSFLLRACCLASLMFLPWLVLCRPYLACIDRLVALLFSLLYPGYRLETPLPFPVYNHPFALLLYLSLLAAGWRGGWTKGIVVAAAGVTVIALWHALFRVTHVVWTALGVRGMAPMHEAVYLIGQFLLPLFLWLTLGRGETGAVRVGSRWRSASLAALLFFLLFAGPAHAGDPLLAIRSTGRGGFALQGENLNRVTEAEVRIDYQSSSDATPRVSGAGLGARANLAVQSGTPGTITLRFKSATPMSGHVLLATAQIDGTVTFLSAWFRNDRGESDTPETSIANPTDEESAAQAKRRQPRPPSAALPSGSATTASSAPPPVAAMTVPHAAPSAAPELAFPGQATRRPSMRDLLAAYTGERSLTALARLFRRDDDTFVQDPPLLLSDGTATLKLTVRNAGASPRFVIAHGNCTRIRAGEEGNWILEILPEKGTLDASVAVLSAGGRTEFPLAVAPPLALFDRAAEGEEAASYVEAANLLAAGFSER